MFITSFCRVFGLSSVLLFLSLALPAVAAPVMEPVSSPSATMESPAALPHAGYPTTRDKWRYCPRDGVHPCVELDIPGVTVPEQPATGQTAAQQKTGQ